MAASIFLLLFVIVMCFGFVLLFGAPYLPTHKKQIALGLKMAALRKDEVVYELGCGDGYILREIARRGGRAVGYELNPILFIVAWLSCLKYGGRIKVRYGNFWNVNIAEADIVYVFLLEKFMKRLDQKMLAEAQKGTRLLSYTFKIPGKKIIAEAEGMYLYQY